LDKKKVQIFLSKEQKTVENKTLLPMACCIQFFFFQFCHAVVISIFWGAKIKTTWEYSVKIFLSKI
jgi:hypothetical protein